VVDRLGPALVAPLVPVHCLVEDEPRGDIGSL
jgi:hypothetical protein